MCALDISKKRKIQEPSGEAVILKPVFQPTLIDIDEIADGLREIWSSRMVTVAKYNRLFERAIADHVGVREAVAVSSCTSGLVLVLKALGLKGEVIVPGFTFAATAHALVWNGLKPVFCDALPDTFNLDPEAAGKAITENTSAIMPVYVFGLPPDHDRFREIADRHGLKLVFDSAQGLGSTYRGKQAGCFGDAEVFSFSPTKVVTALEGGVVTTNNEDLSGRLRQLRDYGKAPDGEDMDWIGLNARMSEVHALVGLKNFSRMDHMLRQRGALIERYRRNLSRLAGVYFQRIPDDRTSSFNYIVIGIDRDSAPISRDVLYEGLKARGIQTKRYFYPVVCRQTAYTEVLESRPVLEVAERLASQAIALPLYSHMEAGEVDEICKVISGIFEGRE